MALEPDSIEIAAVEELIVLVNPTGESAARQLAAFREALPALSADQRNDGDRLIWTLKDIVEWETGFFVDWKDTESFVQCMDVLCAGWNATIDWGEPDAAEDKDFPERVDLPGLLQIAFTALAAQGLTLWSWDTQGDAYGGWIARSASDGKMLDVSSRLEVHFY
ncbi:DUF6630 family protein [Variovorax rhizosphaerae]|uniref:DUF6630 domain-containing protein n=1 Tax=Variovorax rhizosphaerae TaxID=1836200 RepID=A0ABU8WRB5_9BURK